MATSQMSKVIQHLRSAALLGEGSDLTDGQLLESFVSRRELPALEALVRRHGAMIWGVCRRILRNEHDAEDAFQATFLVLVRKAASIVPREMVGNWLYGVARQTALKARTTMAIRQTRETPLTKMPEPATAEKDLWNDLQPLLDQELGLLPDKYRVVIILCDLEGKSGHEAACHLGCPEGTVRSRLTRARTMLAKRLARYNLAVSAGALAAALSHKAASACVPASVMSSTIKAVSLVAAGNAATGALISAKAAALTEGVLKAMFLAKLKSITVVLLMALGTAGIGGALYMQPAGAQQRPAGPPPAAWTPAPNLGASETALGNGQLFRILELKPDADGKVELGKLKDLTVTTAGGQEISKEDALKRLANGGTVVVSVDGKKVSPACLKMFKDDVLVLISPDLAVAGLGGPVLQPLDIAIKSMELTVASKRSELAATKERLDDAGRKLRALGAENDPDHLAAKKSYDAAQKALEAEQIKLDEMKAIDPIAKKDQAPSAPAEPTAEQLAAAIEAYRKLGATYRAIANPKTMRPLHLFSMPTKTTDADLKGLSDLPFRFGLNLELSTQVTDMGMKELKDLKNLSALYLTSTKVADAGLKDLQGLKNLSTLSLVNTKVTDAGLKELKDLKNLATLGIGNSTDEGVTDEGVTDAGLNELKELKNLTELILFGTHVTDAGLRELKGLKNLTDLNLFGTKVTATGLKDLKELKNLSTLSIANTEVTDTSAKELKGLSNLTRLYLNGTQVTDAGMRELKELTHLTHLSLDDTQVTDAGMKELKELKNLSILHLERTQLTDAGLKEIKELKNLTALNLNKTKVTNDGVKQLQDALPNCKITAVPAPIDVKPAELAAANEAYAKFGATHEANFNPQTNQILHTFKMPMATTDANLKGIPQLPFSFGLDLFRTKVTDAGMKEIKELKNLTYLGLWLTKVTDAGLKDIKELKNLTRLSLTSTQVTDAGLKEIKELQNLTALDLNNLRNVTDAGLKEIKELKRLTDLQLAGTQATDAGLKDIKELENLTTLLLGGTKVTDAGIKEIKELKNLTFLGLDQTKVTDEGLKELKELKKLTTLRLGGTKVTDDGVKQLQTALPNCRIVTGPAFGKQ
jgi:internalin A